MTPSFQLLMCAVLIVSMGLYGLIAVLFTYGNRRMLRLDQPSDPGFRVDPDAPGVTILKPCAGHDDDLLDCLETYARLNYPRWQLILGVQSTDDTAYTLIREFARRHPDQAIEVLVTGEGRSVNLKIANIEKMLPRAKYELILLSDSNTVAHPDALGQMVQELHQPGVGGVVSPVVGLGERKWGSFFDNLTVNAPLWMGSVAAHLLSGRVIAPGKCVLVRRKDLEAVGLDAMGRSFGDDEVLVTGLVNLGHRVLVGRRAVGGMSRDATMRRALRRHLRWMQIRWTMAPLASCLYEAIMAPMIPALALLMAYPSMQHLAWFAEVCAYQVAIDVYGFSRMRGELPPAWRLPMVLARPIFSFGLWFTSAIDRRVTWRGKTFWMGPGATVLNAPPELAKEAQPVLPTNHD
jgi:ceramide glucosyltransferase